jgi:hypothetical protein
MTEVQTGIVPGDNEIGLGNFQDTPLVRRVVDLTGRPHNVLVLGKVVIRNDDGDAQNAAVRLTANDTATEIDRVDIRIPAGQFGVAVSVMGWITAPDIIGDRPIIDIRASTFRGVAQHARLTVTVVDTLT